MEEMDRMNPRACYAPPENLLVSGGKQQLVDYMCFDGRHVVVVTIMPSLVMKRVLFSVIMSTQSSIVIHFSRPTL